MAVTITIGRLRQVAQIWNPGAPQADGEGDFSQVYTAADPAEWRCAIEAASVKATERHFPGTVLTQASHVLTGRFHAGISTFSRIVWVDRAGETHTANVLDVDDTEGAGVETVVLVSELVDATTPTDSGWMQTGWTQ